MGVSQQPAVTHQRKGSTRYLCVVANGTAVPRDGHFPRPFPVGEIEG